ncbi:heavy-metal-associated domain-containing protein [Dokdonia sp. Dokd-P16]|uniref:heavy-metal-associated domain-containing protein n=1 Tax=Dokdonia sp. Dokd-P16 TaxID=2173169 RepID=UPI00194DE399|nr:heavy metal-associated domain-containing protein [Dokdonia sp. Dokd-P16]
MIKQAYTVKGMTCNGCRAGVEKKLGDIDGVANVIVSLEDEEAILTMVDHISIKTLQDALPEKYSLSSKKVSKAISETQEKSSGVFVNSESATQVVEESKLQQLKPLLLILFYITVASVLLNYKEANWQSGMLDFMGLFYIVFSFFKMLDLKGFSTSFSMYDPLAHTIPAYGKIYPFIETVLGLMFLMRVQVEMALIATIVILGITTVGVTKTLLSKKEIQCACLGTALKLPMTEATFIENAIMIIMAIIMLIRFI